jgi:hypothetical protein
VGTGFISFFLAGRIAKGNRNPEYIFGGPALEQKLHNTERSKGKADRSEGGAAEAAFGKIRSNQSWPHNGRSNGHGF